MTKLKKLGLPHQDFDFWVETLKDKKVFKAHYFFQLFLERGSSMSTNWNPSYCSKPFLSLTLQTSYQFYKLSNNIKINFIIA